MCRVDVHFLTSASGLRRLQHGVATVYDRRFWWNEKVIPLKLKIFTPDRINRVILEVYFHIGSAVNVDM